MSYSIADAAVLFQIEKIVAAFRRGAISWNELMAQVCYVVLSERRLDLAASAAERIAQADHPRLKDWAEQTLEECGGADLADLPPDTPYLEQGDGPFAYRWQPAALADLARGMLAVL